VSTYENGKSGEQRAVKFLQEEGFQILERNFRNHIGEIDIICKKENVLYFVEVKSWKGKFIHPLEIFTKKKIYKMRSLAEYYFIKRNVLEREYYVSFAMIYLQKDKIEFFQDLF
jgi:putative endonuclease